LNASAGLDLPCIMDDRFFASTTHLNAQGAQIFTAELARQLPR
jgi:hypothetical protein